MRRAMVAVACLVCVVASACNSSDPETNDAFADPSSLTIRYHFNDASVPPDDHRSYVIGVDGTDVSLTVDSYGDVLAEEQFTLSDGAYDALVESVQQVPDGSLRGDCDGGASRALVVESDGEQIFLSGADTCSDEADERFALLREAMSPVFDELDIDGVISATY